MKLRLFFLLLSTGSNLDCHFYDFDHIIIGGGTAGFAAARSLRTLGKTVAIVERSKLGGSRVWHADVPTKTLLHVANTAYKIHSNDLFGNQQYHTHVDTASVLAHVRQVIEKVYKIDTSESFDGITFYYGTPHFIDEHTITLAGQQLTAEKFIITTGSHAFIPPIENIEQVPYLIPETIFKEVSLPSSMIILGGGPLGVEMACALNQLGIHVTLIMKYKTLLPSFDEELVKHLTQSLEKSGVEVVRGYNVTQVSYDGTAITAVAIDEKNQEQTFTSGGLFIALNRIPNTKDLNLADVGVTVKNNAIITNQYMQTSNPNIFACGDVVGGSYLLNRVAYYQAKTAAYNSTLPWWQKQLKVNYTLVSKIVFSLPPIASLGLTEKAARALHGDAISIYRCKYENIDRAHIENTTEGMIKCVCDKHGILVGVHIFGAWAGELMDQLTIGEPLTKQFENYINEIHTSPSYFDLLWKTTEQARAEKKPTIYEKFLGALKLW